MSILEKIPGSVENHVKSYRCLKIGLSKILIFVAGKKIVLFLFLRLSRETRINMQHGGVECSVLFRGVQVRIQTMSKTLATIKNI